MARTNLIEIIVSGVSSSSKYFVAINDAPQKRTASKGNKYVYFFVLIDVILCLGSSHPLTGLPAGKLFLGWHLYENKFEQRVWLIFKNA